MVHFIILSRPKLFKYRKPYFNGFPCHKIKHKTWCRIFFICAHFFMRIANVTFFLYSLTVCTSSIFGGEPDIKVQIFSGYSSPDFKGEVLKNTQQSIQNSQAKVFFGRPQGQPSQRESRTNKTKNISIMATPCGVRQTVGSNAGMSQSATLK